MTYYYIGGEKNMKKNKKITLIVILSSVLLLFFLVSFIFKYEDDTYKEIKMILSKIERSNDYLYYNDEHFYYKGNDYFFDKFFEDTNYSRGIEFINNDFLIYSEYNKRMYYYYLMDREGNSELVYCSKGDRVEAFIDDTIYLKTRVGNAYCYGTYSLVTQTKEELTIEEFYMKVYDSKYFITWDDGYIVTDTKLNSSKRISIKTLLCNPIIKDLYNARKKLLFAPDLIIENVMVYKNDIFVLISPDGVEGITVKYDFDSETSDVIDKFKWKYLEPYVIMFDLNKDVCKPVEYLLEFDK